MLILSTGVAAAEPKEPSRPVEKSPPIYSVELRIGKGVEMGGSGEMTTTRGAPMNVSCIVAIAIRDQPWVNAYGGMIAELVERNAVGAVAGLQMPVENTPLRVAAGATYMFKPFTLWGASASVGACKRARLGICGDVELTAWFAGTDLAEGRTVTQLQARIGVVFDAL